MIVQHVFTGHILQAVRMAGAFIFEGIRRDAGDVIVCWPHTRQVVSAVAFPVAFIELAIDAEGVLCELHEVTVP